MRSEQAMLELILEVARDDERIRVVMDFDIVYLVADVAPFRRNLPWIERFGELMILQLPDEMQDPPPGDDSSFAYLMQFADGNRIDLGIYPLHQLDERFSDSLTVLLLDKDGIVGPLEPPSERGYLPKPPTARQFADCCNEFWWVCPYVAKGLWRQEILYARHMLDQVVREQLMQMLAWHIGVQTGFARNPGKFGKHFQRYLEPELWQMLERTYAGAGFDDTWEALLTMGSLFERIAVPLAGHFGFDYPAGDARRVRAHLEHVRRLPRDATEIYP